VRTYSVSAENIRASISTNFFRKPQRQLFFFNAPGAVETATTPAVGGLTDFQNVLQGAPGASFVAAESSITKYRTNDFAVFAQDDWKVRPNLTVNLGLRVEEFGAFRDEACHIGNLDQDLAAAGQYPFIYGNCVSKLSRWAHRYRPQQHLQE